MSIKTLELERVPDTIEGFVWIEVKHGYELEMICDEKLREIFNIPDNVNNIIIDIYDENIEKCNRYIHKCKFRKNFRFPTFSYFCLKRGEEYEEHTLFYELNTWISALSLKDDKPYYFTIVYVIGSQQYFAEMRQLVVGEYP